LFEQIVLQCVEVGLVRGTYATKGGTPARLGYYDNYLVDNHSWRDRGSASNGSANESGNRGRTRHAHALRAMANTRARIGGGRHDLREREFLQWLADRSITPYMRTRDSIHRKNSPFYGPERFTYQPENNRYICPAGQPLNYGGRVHRNRAYNYIGTRKRCSACSQRGQCTSAAFRSLITHWYESARQGARELANTPEFAKAQRQRKKVEA
jgi:hypothetical protein